MHQDIPAPRVGAVAPEHRLRVQASAPGQRARDVTADRIGGFRANAERRAGDRRERLRERGDLRCVRMLDRAVAEQDCASLARQQARGDHVRGGDGLEALQRRGRFPASALRGGDDDLREHVRQQRRRDDRAVRERKQPVVVDRMQRSDLRAFLRCLAQPMREQRLILAQEAADDEHPFEPGDVGDRQAEVGNAVALRVVAEIGLPQPEVDVIAAEPAHQSRDERHLLQRRMRRHERAERARSVLLGNVRQTVRREFQRRRPVDGLPFAALLDHRRGQPLAAVQRLIRETVLVGDPAFVHRLVLERQHAHDAIVLDLHDKVAAMAVVRGYALAP